MKKLLYTFLAVSIIFSACEEEDAAPPSSSAICGNVNMLIDGANVGYNPVNNSLCYSGNIISAINGNINSIGLSFMSNCSSGTDYSVLIQHIYPNCSINNLIGTSTPILDARYNNYNCQIMPINNSYLANIIGTLEITSFDYSVAPALISGSFQVTETGKPEINCTFTNVPTTFMNM